MESGLLHKGQQAAAVGIGPVNKRHGSGNRVREQREDPAFQQVWQQRALDRDGCARPDLSQLQGAHGCSGQEWETRTALLNILVWLQRGKVPADGESSQTQEVMPPGPPQEVPLHRAPVAKDGPMSQGRQPLEICPLPSNTYIQPCRLQFQLCDTSSHLDNLSSHSPVLLGHTCGRESLHRILSSGFHWSCKDTLWWHVPERECLVHGRDRIQLPNDRMKSPAQHSHAPVYLD